MSFPVAEDIRVSALASYQNSTTDNLGYDFPELLYYNVIKDDVMINISANKIYNLLASINKEVVRPKTFHVIANDIDQIVFSNLTPSPNKSDFVNFSRSQLGALFAQEYQYINSFITNFAPEDINLAKPLPSFEKSLDKLPYKAGTTPQIRTDIILRAASSYIFLKYTLGPNSEISIPIGIYGQLDAYFTNLISTSDLGEYVKASAGDIFTSPKDPFLVPLSQLIMAGLYYLTWFSATTWGFHS
jgi:hypothetical protein